MFPSTRVGWSGLSLSCFSLAICGPRAHGCRDDIQVQLVFYSTFEPMVLPMGGPMDAMGVQKLYAPSPTPILYVGLAANVLGRVPLMPLFLLGNYTLTIPHQLRQHRSARFPGFHMGWQMQPTSRAGREATSRANVYEINQWLWQFGLPDHPTLVAGNIGGFCHHVRILGDSEHNIL